MYCKEYNEYEIIHRITKQHKLHLQAISILHDVDEIIRTKYPLWNGYTHNTFNKYYTHTISLLEDMDYMDTVQTMYTVIRDTEEIPV